MTRPLFIQQFLALFRKNALVAWRNRRATILRLLAPFFFLLLALVIDKAIRADNKDDVSYRVDLHPTPSEITPIPKCHEDVYIGKRKCYDFLYTPANDPDVEQIVTSIRDNNGAKKIPADRVRGFADMTASNEYMLKNPETTLGAIHFKKATDGMLSFVLQTNTSVKYFKNSFQDPNRFAQLPLQVATHREIARFYLKKAGRTDDAAKLQWNTGIRLFAHPAVNDGSILGFTVGPFLFAACMFSFVIQLNIVVTEKENGLRQALQTMGMKDSAYWLSWMGWEMTMAAISSHFICIFGLILQFRMFHDNNYGILFFVFFLFQLSMTSLALFLATFVAKAAIAIYIGFLIFIFGWIVQTVVLFGVPFSPDYYKSAGGHLTRAFAAMPWSLLAKALQDLGDATAANYPGIEWDQRYSYCKNIQNGKEPSYDPKKIYYDLDCVYSIGNIMGIWIVLWLVYGLAAVYLDNVLPNSMGVRRSPFYIFQPSYWFPKAASSRPSLANLQANSAAQVTEGLDEDVAREQASLKQLLDQRVNSEGSGTSSNAVEVFGLRKVFPAGTNATCCGGCCNCCGQLCSCAKGSEFVAIRNSWFAIQENTLFCLLGPNGAGKTTTINCLTGVLPPTHGDALVYGESISSEGGLDRIRSRMGVCPQFDVLWNELSGREHLEIYGAVKGIEPSKVKGDAAELLEKVKLTYAGQQRTSSYSGGMKRRLSVAIALLGDPSIVYLDEPTTGMDPISRRYVWDIIEAAKRGRAIILTTHSMEEADILGDRIAIMARGQLRCLGSSIRLKQRFGAGYQVSVSVLSARGSATDLPALAARADKVKALFRSTLGLEPVDESKAYMSYLVGRQQQQQLITMLQQLEVRKQELGITDIQLSLTTLEEVFLTIARQAEMEEAMRTGKSTVDATLDDGQILKVPVGAPSMVDPASGISYNVTWTQDDSGKLVVLQCTPMARDQLAPVS